METIKISNSFELNIEDYFQGSTLLITFEFYSDDKFTVPEDVSAMQWFMDITPFENCHSNFDTEVLSIGEGIEYGSTVNEIIVSKILTSPPGSLPYSLRSVAGDFVRTRGTGIIISTKKI